MSTLHSTAAACLEADSASKLLLIIAKDVVGTLIVITEVLSMCSGYNPNQGISIHKGLAAQYGLQIPPAYIYIYTYQQSDMDYSHGSH